jgi:flagellar biosynthesis protein FliQ
MPALSYLNDIAQEALVLAVALSVPAVAAAALVSLITAVLQAAMQLQDTTLAHLPRLFAVAAAVAMVGPWMGAELIAFAGRMFSGG